MRQPKSAVLLSIDNRRVEKFHLVMLEPVYPVDERRYGCRLPLYLPQKRGRVGYLPPPVCRAKTLGDGARAGDECCRGNSRRILIRNVINTPVKRPSACSVIGSTSNALCLPNVEGNCANSIRDPFVYQPPWDLPTLFAILESLFEPSS